MNGADDDHVALKHARALVSRYAHQAGWERDEDDVRDEGWAAVFTAEMTTDDGVSHDRLLVWRPLRGAHTSFRFQVDLEGQGDERDGRILAVARDLDLAAARIDVEGRAVLEASTRLYDPGLNQETFEHVVESLFALRDAVSALSDEA